MLITWLLGQAKSVPKEALMRLREGGREDSSQQAIERLGGLYASTLAAGPRLVPTILLITQLL